MINIIDLFSGAGGLTEGFRNQQYKILGHVEKEKAACETLKLREVYYYLKKKNKLGLYNDFLNSKTSIEDLLKHIPQEKLNKILNFEISQENIHSIFSFFDDLGENVDGIIGGPPCQAYSTIGRARNASKKSSDERIYLYKFYIHFLNKYQPKFFIFENVKGLLSFRDADDEFLLPRMKKEFEEAGYSLGYEVLNTKNYGVPQSRERLIIFGVMNEKKELIQEFFKNLKKYEENEVDVKTAFQGLPSLKAGEVNNSYTNLSNDYVEQNFLQDSKTPLTQNIARPNNSNDLAIYKIVAEAKKNGKNIKYSELDSKLKTHKHTDKFLDRFKALSWNSPSHTVVAHISKDGHHYIHPDTKQNRSITVREAARLQGFPDNYYFLDSRTSAFTQIGNAVPPIFSKKMADAILTLEFK
ncbi:DNA cytosine methyltransferase [Streptococcus oralis]|uniref:Cytosine-specific methyltransferase n=1 Tax=Streptococcus oralis subsp. tigurinus TaxID=1077464 RepID=A0AAX0N667_STROR|nr:DNA cytosine methyltransferase [Streptococcus oralis]MCY7107037.1 DNA cytosine methyltransferase [Streptococcus oralis]MDU6559227.1 DNA cytosine methyltransferase [Streptococcus sp.]ORO33728.1 DNA (cytosine-5-)-methyltransferase [Streptococcus oralis subsp. tigurinus]